MSLFNLSKFYENHPLKVIVGGAVVVAGTTWTVLRQTVIDARDVAIATRDEQIKWLDARVTQCRAEKPETNGETWDGAFERLFPDGEFETDDQIIHGRIQAIKDGFVSLTVEIPSEQSKKTDAVRAGERMTVKASDADYFLDVLRVREGYCNLKISHKLRTTMSGQ